MLLWVLPGILIAALPCAAVDVEPSDTLNLSTSIEGDWLNVYGTLNMYVGAYVDWGIHAYANSTANIYGGTIGAKAWNYIQVDTGATVTVYGTDFVGTKGGNVDGTSFTTLDDPTSPDDGTGVLQGTYENGDPINLLFYSDVAITLASPGDPAVAAIKDLLKTVEEMNLQNGIDNSLDAKLEAAAKALEDVKENNDASAVNKLEAFISEVEAQRGKKLTDEQADALHGDAQAIIDLLLGA